MHFHAEHTLFFKRHKPLWQVASSLVLTVCMLIVNAGMGMNFSLVGSVVGFSLLIFAYIRGHRRIESVFAWVFAFVVLALLGGAFLSLDLESFFYIAARIMCGVIWVLWLGTQMDWVSLRDLLLTFRVPQSVVVSLDHALMHGILTQKEWSQRRDSARLRQGSYSPSCFPWPR